MANGLLGNEDLVASTNTVIYTPSATKTGIITVNICNRNASSVTASVAIASNTNPALSEYIEYETTIPANGVLERPGIALTSTSSIVVNVSANNVSATVFGLEQTI